MERIIELSRLAAKGIEDIAFFKTFIPIIFVVGFVSLIFFGIMGIVKKKTFVYYRMETEKFTFWVEGPFAVIFGILYLIRAVVILFILGPLSLILMGII